MTLRMNWLDRWKKSFGSKGEARAAVLDVLNDRYIREKQHVTRYRQHAERMRYSQFHDALLSLAAEEEQHAESIGAKIRDLGENLPDVIPICVPREQNSWYYLRTDLEEERRCAGGLRDTLPALSGEFPEIAELLEHIESDGRRHRAQIRDMLARSDPQASCPG
jgi:hypothetical protein